MVLLYHRVIEEDQSKGSAPEMTVSPLMFDAQLAYISRHYNVISLKDYLSGSEKLKKENFSPQLLITFDDGWLDNYVNAYPILKKHQATALIFLTTGFVGTEKLFWPERLALILKPIFSGEIDRENGKTAEKRIRTALNRRKEAKEDIIASDLSVGQKIKGLIEELKFLDENEREKLIGELHSLLPNSLCLPKGEKNMLGWDEIKSMSKAGISFGAHTRNHLLLDQVNEDTAQSEIEGSNADIEKHLGETPISFAYPNGNYNNKIVKLTRKAGYKAAFTTRFGTNNTKTPLLELRRIRVDENFSRGIGGKFSRCLFEFGIWRHIFKI